jgi:hypothetical protein
VSKVTSYLFDKHSLILVEMKTQLQGKTHWLLKMKETIRHMFSGAGSLLDISGHSKVSEAQRRSARINFDDSSYTSSMSDQINLILDQTNCQTSWMPEDGRKTIENWLNAYQNERDRYKSYVEEGFSSVEKLIATGNKKGSKKQK